MKKHATVDPIMSITVGPAAEVRDLSDDPTALAEAQATLERHEAKNLGVRMIAAARRSRAESAKPARSHRETLLAVAAGHLSGTPAGLRPSPAPLPPQTRMPRR